MQLWVVDNVLGNNLKCSCADPIYVIFIKHFVPFRNVTFGYFKSHGVHYPSITQADTSSNYPQLILCVLTNLTCAFKKINRGMWLIVYVWPQNIVLLYSFNHIPPLICLQCTRQIGQTHGISCA